MRWMDERSVGGSGNKIVMYLTPAERPCFNVKYQFAAGGCYKKGAVRVRIRPLRHCKSRLASLSVCRTATLGD